jgi:hypothetical protein
MVFEQRRLFHCLPVACALTGCSLIFPFSELDRATDEPFDAGPLRVEASGQDAAEADGGGDAGEVDWCPNRGAAGVLCWSFDDDIPLTADFQVDVPDGGSIARVTDEARSLPGSVLMKASVARTQAALEPKAPLSPGRSVRVAMAVRVDEVGTRADILTLQSRNSSGRKHLNVVFSGSSIEFIEETRTVSNSIIDAELAPGPQFKLGVWQRIDVTVSLEAQSLAIAVDGRTIVDRNLAYMWPGSDVRFVAGIAFLPPDAPLRPWAVRIDDLLVETH